jgi:hypothetical protein
MKRMRILGLALAAVCALFAISAVTASAAPEWGACLKTEKNEKKEYQGSFSDKNCSIAQEHGKYAVTVGSIGKGKKFKVKGLGNQTLHSVVPGTGDVPITCTKLKGEGLPKAPNAVEKVNLEFKKCTTLEGSVPCENVGKETIKTNTLDGTLAEVGGKVGEILTPESGPFFVEFSCGAVFPKVRVLDQVFGEYTGQLNTVSKVSIGHYTVENYLGEPLPGYKPITNIPSAGPPTYGVLHTEAKNKETEEKYKCETPECYLPVPGAAGENPEGWGPPGGLPSGQEGETEVKGENLMVHT